MVPEFCNIDTYGFTGSGRMETARVPSRLAARIDRLSACIWPFHRNMRGPLRGACSEGERCEDYGQTRTRFFDIVSASCNSLRIRPCCHAPASPAASRSPWQCFPGFGFLFLENPRRCRAPASSVNERSFPAQPGTGGTESTQTTGRVAAEMCSVTATMPAELLRPTTVIHHFHAHAARTGAIPRLNAAKSSLNIAGPAPAP